MLVQFGNNWIQKIPLTVKLNSACSLVQFWLSSEFFSSNYFQIGQHVVVLHIQILGFTSGIYILKRTVSNAWQINISLAKFLQNKINKAIIIARNAFEWFLRNSQNLT